MREKMALRLISWEGKLPASLELDLLPPVDVHEEGKLLGS